jgi:hypothetical protein
MNWLGIGKLALGAFGAIQSGKAAKQQAQASQTDLKKLRDDAQAAGFNPLTVLRATGGQGFNKGSSGALASATFWGNFANAGVSALNEFDPYNQKRKQLDMQQAQASLDNTMASTQLMKSQSNSQTKSKYRQEDLFVEFVDPSGKIPSFIGMSPDILDTSLGEVGGSIALLATQYAAQNNITVEEAKDILNSVLKNRQDNIAAKTPLGTGELEPIETTILEEPILSNWDSHMDSIRKANVRQTFWHRLNMGEIANQNRQMLSR